MQVPTDVIRILHVDDDPEFAEIAATFLEREEDRFAVETIDRPTVAAEAIESEEYDCIVSDYEMPGMDGIELLETVRAEYPNLPFILYTGKGSEEVASDAISAGVTDYLQKGQATEQYELLAKRIIDAVEHRHAKVNYREIFEKIPDGIVVQDPEDGAFTDMNQRYAELFGYDRQELLEAGFSAIHPDEEPYTLENARQRVEEAVSEGPQTFEWLGETKN
ncbi:MAG: response regulator, partial [Salinirussus sp.]